MGRGIRLPFGGGRRPPSPPEPAGSPRPGTSTGQRGQAGGSSRPGTSQQRGGANGGRGSGSSGSDGATGNTIGRVVGRGGGGNGGTAGGSNPPVRVGQNISTLTPEQRAALFRANQNRPSVIQRAPPAQAAPAGGTQIFRPWETPGSSTQQPPVRPLAQRPAPGDPSQIQAPGGQRQPIGQPPPDQRPPGGGPVRGQGQDGGRVGPGRQQPPLTRNRYIIQLRNQYIEQLREQRPHMSEAGIRGEASRRALDRVAELERGGGPLPWVP